MKLLKSISASSVRLRGKCFGKPDPRSRMTPGLRSFCSGFRSVSSALRLIDHKHFNLLFSFHSFSSPFVHRAIDGYFWHRCVPWSYGIIVYIRAPRWCGDFQSPPCLSLIRDVGVINVLILFRVLGTLSPAVKSSYSIDSEKGRLGNVTISRPLNDTKSVSTFPSEIQGQVTKSATPARSPDATVQGGASYVFSLAKSLFRFHKRIGSSSSSTRMLMREPPSRGHSPTSSLESSESSSSTLPVGRPTAPASNIELPVPHKAVQKSTQPVPRMSPLKIDLPSQHGIGFTKLSPPPRGKRSQTSRDPRPISGPPTLPIVPILEVTLCSPTTTPTECGVGSLINMYISSDATLSGELPPFPDTAVHRDSSASLPRSSSSPSGWPATRLPALSAVDLPVSVTPESIGSSHKAAVSIGAVGGRPTHAHLLPPAPHPNLLSARATSSAGATYGSQYSDSDGDAPPSSEVSAARDTKASAQSGASREGQSSAQDHPAPRTLPLSRSLLSHAQSVKLHKSPSSSSRYGYL
jgi:hypothetical protein